MINSFVPANNNFKENILDFLKIVTKTEFEILSFYDFYILKDTKRQKDVLKIPKEIIGPARTKDFLDFVKNNLPEYFL